MTIVVQLALTTRNIQMPGLLCLLLELRSQIYYYLILIKHIIKVSNPRFIYIISNKGIIGVNITGLEIEDNISDSNESRIKQSA